MSFNGQDDFVDVDHPTIPTQGVTLEAWVYLNSYGQHIVNSQVGFDIGSAKLDVYQDGHARFLTNNDWAGSILTSNAYLNLDTWYQIVGTYDGTTKDLYINGQLDNSLTTSGAMSDQSLEAVIGVESGPGGPAAYGNYMDGRVADVELYSRALSADEVAATCNTALTVSFTTSGLPAGDNRITAAYSGDNNYAPSTSAALEETVEPATAIEGLPQGNVSQQGSAIELTGSVTGQTAGDTIDYTWQVTAPNGQTSSESGPS